MKVSQIGLISTRLKNLDEQFPVQDMLLQTGQLEQFGAGVYAFGHIPFLVKLKLERIISNTLTKHGCSEILLPILQPESIWEESGRLQTYVNNGVMFQTLTDKGNFCLAPTAEEAVVAFARNRLKTYKHLPTTYFQISPKFRNEIRTRGFLLRGKAFDMMDAYSFGRNKQELDVEYENIKQAYLEIFEQLELKVQPVGADSGAIGGSKSEEFMCLSDIGEDNVLFDSESGLAFNEELLEREDAKEYLLNTYGIKNLDNLTKRKAVELGHIFQLDDKYSKPMKGMFVDEDGTSKFYKMGCYGIGVSRTLALIYEQSANYVDGKLTSVVLPESVMPYKFYVIPKLDDEEKSKIALNLYAKMQESGINVLFDDRCDQTIGVKLKDSHLVGVKYTMVLGRTLEEGKVEIENNKTQEKTTISVDKLIDYMKTL